jgi:hydroxyacylglutathione hydrolase
MLVRRLYHPRLAQASYLIADSESREAIIIDPLRDVEPYLAAAAAENVRITAVTETHVHADFISGSRELADRTGGRLYLSGEGRGAWSYTDGYLADAGATLLHGGDTLRIGLVGISVLHTPGHTPEHLSFLVTDSAVAGEPMAAVTGDFVFVGDVGRPDLLERAVHVAGSADAAARQLFASIRHFADHADHLQIWPGHGAGSACGKDLSGVPQSTLGYERRYNWAFGVENEAEFVQAVLAGQPEPPAYFAEMKRINARGPGRWQDVKRPALVTPADIVEAVESGAIVVDIRPAPDFAAGHIPGTLNIPLNRAFLQWAGSLIPADSAITLIGDEAQLTDAVRDLALIGIDHVVGYAGPEVIEAWQRSDRPLEQVAHTTIPAVAAGIATGAVSVVDVRGAAEWDAGHVPGALHVPLGALRDRVAELPRDRPLVVHCQGGGRAAIAASVLLAAGFSNVAEMRGGMTGWRRDGHDVITGQDG